MLAAEPLKPPGEGITLLQKAQHFRAALHLRRLLGSDEAQRFVRSVSEELALPLKDLHQHVAPCPLLRPGADNTTPMHRRLYLRHVHSGIPYLDLCRRVIADLIEEPCYVQCIPTYRFGLPGNRWVGSFHRDSDFGHSAYELNAICALTPMRGSAALQVEQTPGSHRFAPLELEAGEVILFDHIDRLHGCARNREGHSVVSIDFRFVPQRFAAMAFADAAVSINTGTPLRPGGYFSQDVLDGGPG
jgi:hypothetical protein